MNVLALQVKKSHLCVHIGLFVRKKDENTYDTAARSDLDCLLKQFGLFPCNQNIVNLVLN